MDIPKRLIGNAATRGWMLVLSSAILVCGGWACFHYGRTRPPARTYRIGFQYSPPRQFVDAQGRPYGSVIDLLREAARRADDNPQSEQKAAHITVRSYSE